MTFGGDNYAQYSLVERGSSRRRRQDNDVSLRSTFEEQISLRLRTEEDNGLLFFMGGVEDLAYIQVGGGGGGWFIYICGRGIHCTLREL